MNRLALLSLIPRLVANRRERGIRRQGPAFPITKLAVPILRIHRQKRSRNNSQVPIDRQLPPNLQIAMYLQRAINLELAKDLDFIPTQPSAQLILSRGK